MPEAKQYHLGNVVVVGGCGFLGSHTVRMLLEPTPEASYACTSVSAIDLRCDRNRRPDSDGVRYFEADITDAERVLSIFEEVKPDVVIHTASPAAQSSDAVAHELFRRVNVDGTRAIVDACKATGVKVLVFTSSASVISDCRTDLINADERWLPVRGKYQVDYYAETKAAAEEIVLQANEPSKLLTCSIRPAGIIGEGDTMTIFHLLNILRQGRWNVQVGDNDNLFDFTYVGNVVHAHLLAARALLLTYESTTQPLNHERVDGEAFLVTNDTPMYFWDFCRTVWKHAGSPHGTEKVWKLPRELGMVLGWLSEWVFWAIRKPPTFNRQRIVYSCMTRYYDISKAKRRLGYRPIVPLEEGIKRGVKWALEQEKARNAAAGAVKA